MFRSITKRTKMLILPVIVAVPLALGGCAKFDSTVADVVGGAQTASGPLNLACSALLTLSNTFSFIPKMSDLQPYIVAGCGTASGLAKLLADPASLEWVGQLEGEVKGLISVATGKPA